MELRNYDINRITRKYRSILFELKNIKIAKRGGKGGGRQYPDLNETAPISRPTYVSDPNFHDFNLIVG